MTYDSFVTRIPARRIVPFSVTFEGNGHTVSNFSVVDNTADYVGFLDRIDEYATIRNITLANVDLAGRNNVGALAGSISNPANLTNIYATGIVTGQNKTRGIVGEAVSNTISPYSSLKNSYSDTLVNARNGKGLYGSGYLQVTNSYHNKEKATATPLQPGAKTLAQLQSDTPSSSIYTNWDADIRNFGTSTELPTLR